MTPFRISDPLPTGTVVLEASAGTGKTWTIAALVTRFVAEGVVTLPEMLVVTFGRAASQELRSRVREQLVDAAAALGETTSRPEDELLSFLLDVAAEERRERLRRVTEALSSFDAATIATTHQFCQQVLHGLGIAGDTDPSGRLVEDQSEMTVEVVDDLYLRAFRRDPEPPFFSRSEALQLARAVTDDSYAGLTPESADGPEVPVRRRRFADAVRAEMDLRKRRGGVLHFNDLLVQLDEALADEASPARDRMRRRWKVVLVDEFQDTDPVQWSIFQRAFAGHARAMVLIGDPKQAIYAFRGGDVVTYLAAASTTTDHRTLDRNFRADAPLVEALGHLIGGAALGDERIVVRSVDSHHAGNRLSHAPHPEAVRLRQVLKGDHLGGADSIAAVRVHVARDVATDIAGLLSSEARWDGRPVGAGDVAVIAHSRLWLDKVQQELRSLGVNAVTAGGSNVFHSDAADQWLALLEGLEAPHRSKVVRAAALTDLIGRTPQELERGGDTEDDRLAARLRRLGEQYERRGAAAVVELLVAGGLTERVLRQPGGERVLTDLLHVGELLNEAQQQDRLGLSSLVTWLRHHMVAGAGDEADAVTRRLESDAAAVQLLTVHGSKGLQFPVVYLPSLSDRHVQPRDFPLFHDDDGGRVREVGGKKSSTWKESSRRARVEEAGEQLRLLYVALTRAQSQAVVWWAPSSRNLKAAPLHRMLFGREHGASSVPELSNIPSDAYATDRLRHWAATGAFTLERADVAEPEAASTTPPSAELEAARFSRTLDHAWRRTSYTSLSAVRQAVDAPSVTSEPEVVPRDDEAEDPAPASGPSGPSQELDGARSVPSPMAGLPVGATFGSLVHAVLEHLDPAADDLRTHVREVVRAERERWVVALDEEELTDAVVAVCTTPLGRLVAGRSLRELGAVNRLAELDFELPLAGGDRPEPRVRRLLGDLAPLLREHLPDGDAVRAYAEVLDGDPALAGQQLCGYLTGSIDIMLRVDDRYVVADYKTNWLGPREGPHTAAEYGPAALRAAMGHSSYPLQALLYTVVAHRFLRWRLADYSPERHLGGVLYLYLRGLCGPDTPVVAGTTCGVFEWQPPVALVVAVSDLLDGGLEAEEEPA